MEREEALNAIRKYKENWLDEIQEAIETLIPELRESEDEITRKRLINLIRELASATVPIMTGGYFIDGQDKRYIAYLEKQKEPHYTKRNALFDKCVENCDPEVMKEVSNKVNEMLGKEQKPAEWSKKDNIGWDEAFACVTRAEKAAKNEEELQNAVTAEKWLKEIKFKYYVHPVKQEWSEKDEEVRSLCIAIIQSWISKEDRDRCLDWLKSLRPSWKPSEEQMEALLSCSSVGTLTHRKTLKSLYNDLKKQ